MISDDIVRARVDARRAELARSAHPRPTPRRRLRTLHLRAWWAIRPRREITCLVTTPDGAAVLGGPRAGSPDAR